ncbi:MAG: PhzF family phenazine biosynthesis protein [Desulfobacterales bacterium]
MLHIKNSKQAYWADGAQNRPPGSEQHYGISEDPVTGSAYTQLAPYWASKMGLKRFRVKQMSSRGGELTCEVVDDRVLISGRAIKYLEGKIKIDI